MLSKPGSPSLFQFTAMLFMACLITLFWRRHLFTFHCVGSSLLCRLFSSCCERACSVVAVLELLIVVASLVAERGLQGTQASVLWHVCSGLVVPGL